jgi:hypothetical protein
MRNDGYRGSKQSPPPGPRSGSTHRRLRIDSPKTSPTRTSDKYEIRLEALLRDWIVQTETRLRNLETLVSSLHYSRKIILRELDDLSQEEL